MFPQLLHIYGPLAINSFGFMIAVGFLVFLYFTLSHPLLKKIVSSEQLFNIAAFGLISGIVGGRLLYIIIEWNMFKENVLEIFYPWIGGFSMLGSIIAVLITLPLYLKKKSIPPLPLLDIFAIYIPLLHSIGRIGCFLAGCCHGIPAPQNAWYAVTFRHLSCELNSIPLHPAQLYTSIASLFIFGMMLFIARYAKPGSGILTLSFLSLETLSRSIIEFWRGDGIRVYHPLLGDLSGKVSSYQLVAFSIFICALTTLLIVLARKPKIHS
jgi:phosphatidylglycerol---prolipoprotein diacylglyceryl transferase